VSARPAPPPYTRGESLRALYLLARGAAAVIRGKDPAASKWDGKLSELARRARAREDDVEA
jgi:hypothetical protein